MQLLSPTDSPPYSLSDVPETSCACALIVLHMYKKFQVNRTKIMGVCQSETKAAHCFSCSDSTLVKNFLINLQMQECDSESLMTTKVFYCIHMPAFMVEQ